MDDLIKALTILRKYGNPKYPTYCEHDVMYVAVEYNAVSEDDRDMLEALGFIKNREDNNFMSYRFGGC